MFLAVKSELVTHPMLTFVKKNKRLVTVDIWAAVSMEKEKIILMISPESISKDLKTMRFVNLLLLRQLRKTINQA